MKHLVTLRRRLRTAIHISTAAIALLGLTASSAFAQQFFLFDLFQPQKPTYSAPKVNARAVLFHPRHKSGQIFVSFKDRQLYYVYARGRAIAYPIAAPRRGDAWQGVMRITKKRVNPKWTPTASMRRDNPRLPAHVPGGHPQNPLGSRALYLGSSLYRIHGTDAPWTIGHPVSRGCIRMHNRDVNDLYARIPVGTKVTVSYRSYRPRPVQYAW